MNMFYIKRSIMHVRNSVRMTPVNCQNPAWHFLFSPHVHDPSVHTAQAASVKSLRRGPGRVMCGADADRDRDVIVLY